MSIRLLSAAWDLDIPSTEKMVLMCLCDFASDDGGNCWPSIKTIARKCSKSERTVQGALKNLSNMGFLKSYVRSGTSNLFKLDPRRICTPAESAPPQKTTQTPAESAPKPLRTTIINKEKRAHEIPEGWGPREFGVGTKSRGIVDGWSNDEREEHIERFIAHHRSKGTKFKDWQNAWSTWVLNSKRFNGNGKRSNSNEPQNPYVIAALERQAELAADEWG